MEKTGTTKQAMEDPLYRLMRLLVGMRLLVVSAAFFAGHYFYNPDAAFYAVIAFFYAVSIVNAFFLRKQYHLILISQIQLVADIVLATCLVHYTGGIDSVFVLFYPLCILAGAAVGAGGTFSQSIAGGSALFFGLLVVLEYSGVLDTFGGKYSSYEKGPWLVAFLYFFRIFIFGLVCVIGNVLMSRLKYEQSRTRKLENFSTHVLGRMSHGVVTAGAQDKIIYANERALDILGCSFKDLVGKDWRGVFQDSLLCDPVPEPFSSSMSGEGRNEMHLAISCPDGSEKVIGLNFSHQYDEKGQVINKVILFRDLTEVRRMEKKLKASEKWALLGEVAAGITHEIRNPLASVRGSIEVLKSRKVFSASDAVLLDVILKESDRLNQILEDYLAYSQKGPCERKNWDLGVVVDQLIRVVQGHPRLRKDIRLHWEPGKGNAVVCVDDQQIRQVLLNVIQNALDAMPNGGDLILRLDCNGGQVPPEESGRGAPEGRWVRMDVQDTGQGMGPEILDRLYEPFFSTKKDGHGIGLALCRRIVESHQGFLRVKSQVGKGTVFSIYLPAAPQRLRAEKSGS